MPDTVLLKKEDLSQDEQQERKQRIGKRANALMRSGFYSRDDVEGVREMVNNGMCLAQIEWLLLDAEGQSRQSVTPCLQAAR